jgi:carbon starvation protein
VSPLLANLFYETENGRTVLHAMPLLLAALCVIAIAYRYYSAFLAAKVAALDDRRVTPAHQLNDGQNYHPTSKWVLFGHHFAAISGAGPLIGPVLAIQYGYMPGLLWLVIGVCLAGAVQDMLVLAASVRRGGKSLAEIARTELGPWANVVVSAAILFIVVIALAGLGFVVVKALGGDEITLPEGMAIRIPDGTDPRLDPSKETGKHLVFSFPEGCELRYGSDAAPQKRSEGFQVQVPKESGLPTHRIGEGPTIATLPAGCEQLVPGSSWGTFTIACTIPIGLLIGWWMYRFRKGCTVEASLIGAALVLAVTFAGALIPGSPLERFFSLSKGGTVLALTTYGFVASVLPVWLLLAPRDYLSSFLKIGTIALLIVGTFVANPVLPCPTVNQVFRDGGPTFPGHIFPFVFICIMCGSISGFHALVSSGTTPKMVDRESHVRTIGYGAMLMEGIVGIVALIAAASLPQDIYYDINVPLGEASKWQGQLDRLYQELGNVSGVEHLSPERPNLAQIEQNVGGEALRGRTGGAVTLAVGMSQILTKPLHQLGLPFETVMKYWYHFAIMFEALFILTTIDAGTRIARFLLQEAMGRVSPTLGRTNSWTGAVVATFIVTAGWGILVDTGQIDTIWPMFGIANQLLAVIALALITTLLVNTGRGRYAPVTLLPMLFVTATTMTAGVEMVGGRFLGMIQSGQVLKGALNLTMTVFVMACVGALLLLAVGRWLAVARGVIPARPDYSPSFLPPSGLERTEPVSALPSPASDGITPRSEDGRVESEAFRPKE